MNHFRLEVSIFDLLEPANGVPTSKAVNYPQFDTTGADQRSLVPLLYVQALLLYKVN